MQLIILKQKCLYSISLNFAAIELKIDVVEADC